MIQKTETLRTRIQLKRLRVFWMGGVDENGRAIGEENEGIEQEKKAEMIEEECPFDRKNKQEQEEKGMQE